MDYGMREGGREIHESWTMARLGEERDVPVGREREKYPYEEREREMCPYGERE
jgi:hypothetical protein